MRMSIIGFGIGILALQMQPALPDSTQLAAATIVLVIALVLAVVIARRGDGVHRRLLVLCIAVACGFVWAAWRAQWRLADELPMIWEQRDVDVVGVVAELPQPLDRATRFVFAVESSEAPVPGRIQLSWYPPRGGPGLVPQLRPGERWKLTVRVRRPHGFVNPHGFDYEAWLLERNLRATGYVRSEAANERLADFVPVPMYVVHRARDAIRARFGEVLDGRAYAGVLIALAVGDQRAISNAHWEVFRSTGVAHLVSISGLHVSLVALFGGGLVAWGWRRVPWLALRVPTRKAAACGGFIAAALYALIAGLGLPTQRALLMLAVAAIAMMRGREVAASRVLVLALFCVLLFDPWAVLSAGFWLSFGAVGVILFVLGGRITPSRGWRAAVRIQLAIALAMTPALLALFNAFSIVSPVANALAIPLVSLLIAPLALLAIVVPLPQLLQLAHWLTDLMMWWLEWLAGQPFSMWAQASAPAPLLAAAIAGVAWLLLPRGVPARHAALLAFVPVLMWSPMRPGPGDFRVVVLDVGQGLAVHVQTATHDLIYDTGPPYGSVADAGSRVLLPYLAGTGVTRIARMVVSHGDSDHAGGAASLLAAIPVGDLIHSVDVDHALLRTIGADRTRRCQVGDFWDWDGVRFELLHPAPSDTVSERPNDVSCVLRIAGDDGAVLLTGDIEAGSERSLLARSQGEIASEVVVVPHHGSRTSSTSGFVLATGAAHAIHAVGNLNQFRHPHPAVWARWSAAGARNWRTDAQGAIIVDVGSGGVHVQAQRERAPRYWHGR
jgi:competence protein ComEC